MTVSNTGGATLDFSGSFAFSGPFEKGGSGTCGTTLLAHASCTIGVVFEPTGAGSFTGTLTLTDNASPGTQEVQLSGTGR